MEIIIVGAGIGGLSTYLALRQRLPDATITVIEAHAAPQPADSSPPATGAGGGLGLAPNGQRALHDISPAAVEQLRSRSFLCADIMFANSKGQKLGTYSNGSKQRYGFEQVLLSRQTMHDALLAQVGDAGVIEWCCRVETVREEDSAVVLGLADGRTKTADLVVGADGVRSVVRRCLFGEHEEAQYDGLTGIGGFVSVSALPKSLQGTIQNSVRMSFGPDGFFGYALATPAAETVTDGRIMWWSTYESATPPPRDLPISAVHAQLLERHSSWRSVDDVTSETSSIIRTVINLGCQHTDDNMGSSIATAKDCGVLVLPVYTTPRLPHWAISSGRVVLVGDAAHAMPPDSGQGASCAIEDGLALALLLEHHLSKADMETGVGVFQAAKDYEGLRMPRVHRILDIAKRKGDQKRRKAAWEEWVRDWIMWILCLLPERLRDVEFAYDVQGEVKKQLAKAGV